MIRTSSADVGFIAEGGLVLIHNLKRFLSLPEERSLDEAMEALNRDERKDG